MQIRDLTTAGAMPALETMMRFAGARQRVLAHNIANIDTPNFIARDVDPRRFQQVLGEAVDRRRERNGGAFGPLCWRGTGEVSPGDEPGSVVLKPGAPHAGVLRHDRNASDLERLMQGMVENAAMYRVASSLIRQHKSTLLTAISQRVA